jgi:hypothetical protein
MENADQWTDGFSTREQHRAHARWAAHLTTPWRWAEGAGPWQNPAGPNPFPATVNLSDTPSWRVKVDKLRGQQRLEASLFLAFAECMGT